MELVTVEVKWSGSSTSELSDTRPPPPPLKWSEWREVRLLVR